MLAPNLNALLLALALALLPALSSAESDPARLTVADYLEFEQVAEPQLSPDGKKVF